MTQANDSVLVTPGSGATVATHLASGKEYQAIVKADAQGHIEGSNPTYAYYRPHTAGAQNQRTIDIFNAIGSGVIVRLKGLFIYHDLTAITGVGHRFELSRTSAVGTGGTVITGRAWDSTNPAIPAEVTARYNAAGGATVAHLLRGIATNPEETQASAAISPTINWIPQGKFIQDIVLREDEGVLVTQITNNTVGLWAVDLIVTIE